MGKLIIEEKRLCYSGIEYFKFVEEMYLFFWDYLLDDIIEMAIVNILEVVDKVEVYSILGEFCIFYYFIFFNYIFEIYVEDIVWDGLLERLKC